MNNQHDDWTGGSGYGRDWEGPRGGREGRYEGHGQGHGPHGPRGPHGGYPGRGPREEFGGRGPRDRDRDREARARDRENREWDRQNRGWERAGRGRNGGDFGGFFGPDGPFGANGPFGPNGPFGANGVFGEDGPFGRGGPFGRPFGGPADGPMGGPGRGGRPGDRGEYGAWERGGRGHRGHRGGNRGQRGGRARRGDVRLAILGLLAESDMNGYQLIRTLEERTGGAWRPSPGAIYPALSQLEDEGLIEPAGDGKKVFTLTQAGRDEVGRLGDRTRPWEGVAQNVTEQAEQGLGGTAELWVALGQLGLATRAVGQAGDPDVTRAAVELLEESRRGLYRLLAEEGQDDDELDDDPQDDVQDELQGDVQDVTVGERGAAADDVVDGEVVDDPQDDQRDGPRPRD